MAEDSLPNVCCHSLTQPGDPVKPAEGAGCLQHGHDNKSGNCLGKGLLRAGYKPRIDNDPHELNQS